VKARRPTRAELERALELAIDEMPDCCPNDSHLKQSCCEMSCVDCWRDYFLDRAHKRGAR
jgi:hypothetical protein